MSFYARGIYEANKRNKATRRESRLLAFPFSCAAFSFPILWCAIPVANGTESEHGSPAALCPLVKKRTE